MGRTKRTHRPHTEPSHATTDTQETKQVVSIVRRIMGTLIVTMLVFFTYIMIFTTASLIIPVVAAMLSANAGLGVNDDASLQVIIAMYGMPLLFVSAFIFVGEYAMMRWAFGRSRRWADSLYSWAQSATRQKKQSDDSERDDVSGSL